MKSPIDNPFNDSGSNDDPPFKRRFLAQRKWIILSSTTAYLLSHGHLSFVGSIGAIKFDIAPSDTNIVLGLCYACFLFGFFMILNSFGFITKFSIGKREQFSNLQIEDRDTYSEEIEALSTQLQKLEPELAEKHASVESYGEYLVDNEGELNRLLEQFPGIQDDEPPKPSSINALAGIDAAMESINTIRTQRSYRANSAPLNALASPPSDRDAAARRFRELIGRYAFSKERLSEYSSSLAELQNDAEGLRKKIREAEVGRAKVTSDNIKRWRTFYWSSLGADIISFVPSIVGLSYCVTYVFSVM